MALLEATVSTTRVLRTYGWTCVLSVDGPVTPLVARDSPQRHQGVPGAAIQSIDYYRT